MKLMRTAFALFCLTAIAQLTAMAQKTDEWTRFEADGAEFSLEMPRNAELFADKEGYTAWEIGTRVGMIFAEMKMLSASDDTTMMWLETYRVVNGSTAMDIAINNAQLKPRKLENLPKGFSGKEIGKSSVPYFRKGDVPVSFVIRYYASKKNLYVVTALRRGAKNATFERFLNSVRFNETNSGNTSISSMKAFVIDDVGAGAVKSTDNPKTPAKPLPTDPDEDSSPFLVVMKARSPYNDTARRKRVTGTVLLSATFQKNGRISRIELIEGLPDGLNRSAFFATIRMKFLPPAKKGVLENVVKRVEYSFSLY